MKKNWDKAKLIIALCMLLGLQGMVFADQIVPLEANVVANNGERQGIYFNANFDIEVTDEVADVLRRGIALNFVLKVELEKKRWYWLDRTISEVTENIRLAFNPLTRQYKVSIGGMSQNFDTLDQALHMMGTVSNLHISSYRDLNSGSYEARCRFYLDTSRLPKPFQVTLKKGDGWNMDTGWFEAKIPSKE